MITIPRDYLLANVNKFNAYAARGTQYGTAEVKKEHLRSTGNFALD
jgi:hypothetical protein